MFAVVPIIVPVALCVYIYVCIVCLHPFGKFGKTCKYSLPCEVSNLFLQLARDILNRRLSNKQECVSKASDTVCLQSQK